MKIEIHLRDTKPTGKRLGHRALVLESCRVYNEAGDGLRLANVAQLAYHFFHAAALAFIHPDEENTAEKRGQIPTTEQLVEKFGKD